MSMASILLGLAVASGVIAAADGCALARARARARRRVRASAQQRRQRPGPLVALLSALGRRGAHRIAAERLGRLLDAAGVPLDLTVRDLAAIKVGTAMVALACSTAWASALPGRLGIAVLLLSAPAGFLVPDLLLARAAKRRSAQMAREVADVFDLLRVATDAGLSADRALREVGERRGGTLGGELRRAAAQLELGVPRPDAYATLAARCPLEPIAALVAALGRADKQGAPLGLALQALATQARADRARQATEAGARAAPQIQLVVAMVLVPAVMLLLAASLVQRLI